MQNLRLTSENGLMGFGNFHSMNEKEPGCFGNFHLMNDKEPVDFGNFHSMNEKEVGCSGNFHSMNEKELGYSGNFHSMNGKELGCCGGFGLIQAEGRVQFWNFHSMTEKGQVCFGNLRRFVGNFELTSRDAQLHFGNQKWYFGFGHSQSLAENWETCLKKLFCRANYLLAE